MRAGELRHSVNIERASESRDATGGVSKSWSALASGVHAKIEPISSRERVTAGQVVGDATHRVFIRHSSDVSGVTSKDRVVFGSRVFEIVGPAINRLERDISLELLVREEVT